MLSGRGRGSLGNGSPNLIIVYMPDLVEAREAVSRYADRLLELKKKGF